MSDWGSSGYPLTRLASNRDDLLDGSLAGPQIVLNVGAVAVKATPLRGRLHGFSVEGAVVGSGDAVESERSCGPDRCDQDRDHGVG
jgi:hypothetical protein